MAIYNDVWYASNTTENILSIISQCALVIGTLGNVTVFTVIWYSNAIYTIVNIYLLSLSAADLLFLIVHDRLIAKYSKIKIEVNILINYCS